MMAGSIAAFLANRPLWLVVQRWLMGTVLAGHGGAYGDGRPPLTFVAATRVARNPQRASVERNR